MRIRHNPAVLSHERALQDASSCDQQLIGWIIMERLRQLSGFHHDLRMELLKRHARLRKGAFYPSPTDRSSFSLPYSTSLATSQHEMMLTPKTRSVPSSRRSRCLDCSRSGRETHQTQMWVSSRINAGRPSPRRQPAPTDHGTREPNLEGCAPQPSLPLRFSRPPALQPAGRPQMGGLSKRVRHAHRL
jgi:hypothetical protein